MDKHRRIAFWMVVGALIGGLFISFNQVNASILNMTGANAFSIDINGLGTTWTQHINPIYDEDNEIWYFAVGLESNDNLRCCRFDKNFTTRYTDCKACITGTHPKVNWVDYNSTHLWFVRLSSPSYYYGYIKKSDLSTSETSQGAIGTAGVIADISISEDFTWVYRNRSDNDAERDLFFHFNNTTASSQLFINTIHTNPVDLYWLYLDEINEYWLFYRNGTKAYLTRYNALKDDETYSGWQPRYIGFYQTSTGTVIDSKDDLTSYNGAGSQYAYHIEEFVYLIIRQKESGQRNETYLFMGIDTVNTDINNALISTEEFVYLNDSDSWFGNADNNFNASQSPAVYFMEDEDKWWIFYHRFNQSSANTGIGGDEIMLLQESGVCNCGSWIDRGDCGDYIGGHQKQTRSCIPDACDDEAKYTTCDEEAEEVEIENYTFSSETSCSDWAYWEDGETVQAYSYLHIPAYCINDTIELWSKTWGETRGGDNCDWDYYNMSNCIPSFSCYYDNYRCDEWNRTMTDHVTGGDPVVPNANVSAKGTLFMPPACRCYHWYGLGTTGAEYYRVCNVISGRCQKYCEEECICMDDITVGCYDNCEFVNYTTCQSGQVCENGECVDKSKGEISEPKGNPFEWLLGEAETNFPETIRYGFALFSTIGLAVYTQSQTKQWQLAGISALTFIIFWTYIGWLSSWIGIMIGLGIALFLSKSVWWK